MSTQENARELPPSKTTYTSTQATNCAGCGIHKHTPLRIDAMGGYVCLTCIDQKLGSLLGEFGYLQASPVVPEGLTPMLLMNAALCVEQGDNIKKEKRDGIVDKLLAIANQLRAVAPSAPVETKEEIRNEALESAVKVMHKFLDSDYRIFGNCIELKCESHDQAWNYLHEMRDIVKNALKSAPTETET